MVFLKMKIKRLVTINHGFPPMIDGEDLFQEVRFLCEPKKGTHKGKDIVCI